MYLIMLAFFKSRFKQYRKTDSAVEFVYILVHNISCSHCLCSYTVGLLKIHIIFGTIVRMRGDYSFVQQ